MNQLFKEPVFSHFAALSRIPHGSGNEAAIAEYLMRFAAERGLDAKQDETGNVFLRKPGGIRGRHKPTVLLQAHMDMVCEKREGSTHNFLTDPIPLRVEGDYLTTGGETSLGADNGIGVALAMAILEEDHPDFPPLEVLFTVMEEEDLSGALNFDMAESQARYLINLDHTSENDILCGSAGGMEADVRVPLHWEEAPAGVRPYCLRVAGLLGGHSGDDIHRGRGNANVLLARVLKALSEPAVIHLQSIRGGSFRLAIPRDAECILLADPADEPVLKNTVSTLATAFREELQENASQLEVALTPIEEPFETHFETPTKGTPALPVADLLLALPNGVQSYSCTFDGLVHTSCNLGEVRFADGELEVILEIRSASVEGRQDVFERIQYIAREGKGNALFKNEYPGWEYKETSRLRRICAESFRECYSRDAETLVLHCGLEVGCLLQSKPTLDAVSLGPNIWDLHSVSERLSISSVRRFYRYLSTILTKEFEDGE